MKVTQEQLIAYLKQIGVEDVQIVEEESEADGDEQAFLEMVDSNRRAVLEPQLHQQISTQIAGKAGSSLRSQLAKLTGMPRKELDAIQRDNDAIQAALEHKMKGTDSAEQIAEIIRTHEAEMEALRNELSGQAQEWKNKYINRDITSNIRTMLDSAPIPTRADKNILAEDFRNYLAQKYDLSYDESKRAISLFQKGKGDEKMPAIANGNKLVSLDDELRNYFEPRNLWEKDMRREPAPDPAKAAPRSPAPSQGPTGNPMNGSPVQRSLDAFRQFVEAAKEQN